MQRRASVANDASLPYGAAELKAYAPRALLMSFGISALLVPAAVSLLTWLMSAQMDRPPVFKPPGGWKSIEVIFPPPSLVSTESPGVRRVAPTLSAFSIPVPVPDFLDDTSVVFPNITELREMFASVGEPGVGGEYLPLPIPVQAEPRLFEPREVDPVVVKEVRPDYPPLAIKAGLEGNVIIRVWVNTDGLVRKAEVLRSDGVIFEQPALAAARQWVFTPALMQDRPVSVWVTIPVKFRLRERL